jgi:haloalkane dehalogenase
MSILNTKISMSTTPSSDFPFESKYLSVNGSNIHYIDVGEGDPVVFIHGNPTSSYLWRNVIPHVSPHARCIALDLIGMGKSDKPDIDYTFEDHFSYVEGFIKKMGLKNVTLVIHDWGSGLGFHYANMHRDNIKGIAFMEAMYKPLDWADMPKDYRMAFHLMRAPFIGWLMISVGNIFLKKMLPESIVRKLSPKEYKTYLEPYPTVKSRKPVRVWPQEIPINGSPKRTHEKISSYHEWLKETEIPKLCFYANPGALIQGESVAFIKENFPNTQMVDIGKGVHFIQEDAPDLIGEEVAKWYQGI